jgi:hypothetical protein
VLLGTHVPSMHDSVRDECSREPPVRHQRTEASSACRVLPRAECQAFASSSLRSAALASNVVASMPMVFPFTRPSSESLQNPREDAVIRFEIDQTAVARNRRMIRRQARTANLVGVE